MEKIIEVQSLTKSYMVKGKEIRAVKGIDFYVEKGTLFSFLGKNGAGKSTTIDILCTLLEPDAGKVLINGFELGKNDFEIRQSIGIVFQRSLLDSMLTVYENLKIRGKFYKFSRKKLKERIEAVTEIAQLQEFLHQPYEKLSGGQRRRADIARALINTPQILFLDEPTTGLDSGTRKEIWATIRALQKEKGVTVFLTTHYMEEAEQSDYITIMGHGEILAKGTPLELKIKYCHDLLKIVPKNPETFKKTLTEHKIDFVQNGEVLEIILDATTDAIPLVERFRYDITNVEIVNGTMDDVFLDITGQEDVQI
ncbi:MAG: ATP-binding cassette domain-containing protein [Defluviitaleaceae bacterium]|nr:ATP-binding cassette domain-containing protein [Defluviitaleaceae bacterium]